MAARERDALLHGGPVRLRLARKRSLGLGEQPRVSLGGTRDHHGVAAGALRDGHGVGAASHVAVAHDGHAHGLLHPRDSAPLGAPAVQLLGIAPVHGYGAGARVLHPPSELGGGFVALGPPSTELHRDGAAHRCAHRAHDGGGQRRILHERRAVALRHDLSGRTAHVDVEVGQRLPHLALDPRSLGGHRVGLVAEQLHGHLALPRMPRLLVRVGKALGRHHLGVGEVGALLAAERAERLVAHARHGGEQQTAAPEERVHILHGATKP